MQGERHEQLQTAPSIRPPDADADAEKPSPEVMRLTIPPRYFVLPATAAATGLSIGLIRGGRAAARRFLAENAHRPPRTVEGWYFYKKTKNYRTMWGGLKAGGGDAVRLGAVGLAWAGAEDGMERVGLGDVREVGAGLGTAGLFSAVYRLPMLAARRAILLGVLIGSGMSVLRYGQAYLRREAQAQQAVDRVPIEEENINGH